MPSTDMVDSIAPRQTLLEKKIESLGLPTTQRLVKLLLSAVIGVSSVLLRTASARANPLLSFQILCVVLFFCISPLFVHLPPNLSSPPQAFGLLAFAGLALFPVTYAFLRHLVYGHVYLEEPQWYDAVWRVYAVLGMWMLFAIINEAKIRPWLRQRAIRKSAARAAGTDPAPPPPNSVAARADAMRRKKRDEKLAELREAIIKAKRRREAARKAVQDYEGNKARARDNVISAEKMLEKAEDKVAKTDAGDEREEAVKERDAVAALLEGAVAHESGLEAQTEAQASALADSEEKIKELDEKWAHWSNLENYPFYR